MKILQRVTLLFPAHFVSASAHAQMDSTTSRVRLVRRRLSWVVVMLLLMPCMFSGGFALAQTAAITGSPEDIKAIEALVHSNPSDHVTEDVSFTNIFGTVRFGREEFIKRHIEIGQTFFKGTTGKSSITKLRFVRPDVAVVDVAGELSGFQKVYPGLPVGKDGILRNKLLLVLVKENGVWWITEFHNVAQTPEI